MIVVGSRALFHHIDSDLGRNPADWDVICVEPEMYDFLERVPDASIHSFRKFNAHKYIGKFDGVGQVEFEIAKDNSGALYLEYCKALGLKVFHVFPRVPIPLYFAPAEVLYSIKKSHIHYPLKFDKHIADYHKLRTLVDGQDILAPITAIRAMETEQFLGKNRTPKLNKPLDMFFNQSVVRYFVHDEVHRIFAIREKPAYQYMQEPGQTTAKVHKELFDKLDYEGQLNTILEEAMVLAFERCVAPCLFGGQKWVDGGVAFRYALVRLATNLSSGWWREFVVDNYFEVLRRYEEKHKDYVARFLGAVDAGTILRI